MPTYGVNPYIQGAATANNLDPALMARIAHIESGGNPYARTGSYQGLFQLSNDEFRKYGGGNIYNPADNSMAAGAKLRAEMDAFNDRYGRQPTATEIYLTHQQGQGGFAAHNSNPDQLAWKSMASTGEGRDKGEKWAKAAIWGNVPDDLKDQYGSVDNITSQQFMDLWRHKVERTPLENPFTDGGKAVPFTQGQSATPNPATPNDRVADTFDSLNGQPAWLADAMAASTAQKKQGPTDMPVNAAYARGALSAGPGALSPDAEKGDWGDALQSAGAWLMAPNSNGASLGALGTINTSANQRRAQDQLNKQQLQTHQALLTAGVPADLARAAALSPEVLKTIAPSYFGGWKVVQTGEDPFGRKIYQQEGPGGQIRDLPGSQGGAGGGNTGGVPNGPDGAPLQGPELLTHLEKTSPADAAMIKAIIRGDANLGSRNIQKYGPMAALVDPTMAQYDYPTRAKMQAYMTSGKGGQEAKAINTSIAHAGQLLDVEPKLGGSNVLPSLINPIMQKIRGEAGDTEFQQSKKKWDTTSEALAVEISKALNGGQTAVADRDHWRSIFNAADSPAARKAAISSAMDLLYGRVTQLDDQYKTGFGKVPIDFINSKNREAMDKIRTMKPEGGTLSEALDVADTGVSMLSPATMIARGVKKGADALVNKMSGPALPKGVRSIQLVQ